MLIGAILFWLAAERQWRLPWYVWVAITLDLIHDYPRFIQGVTELTQDLTRLLHG